MVKSLKVQLAPVTIELLGAGRKLANDLGEELSILLMGSQAGALAQEAIAFGADNVYYCRRCSVGRVQF